jgi:alcohol dehydrogenase
VRAALFDAFGVTPTVVDVADPACPRDGVVVQVEATGLCRSDWHGWMGHDPDIRLPHVPGHEFAGVVVEAGPDVREGRVGDRVTTPFVCACGTCRTCRRGDQQICERQQQPGFTYWGSFATYVVIPVADVNAVPLPAAMPFDTAAALGCRFATAYRAVTAHARVAPGGWLAVHGCGGVGLSAVMIAVAAGVRVVAVDPSASARGLARDLGADHVLDPAAGDVGAAVLDLSGGGVDASVDAIGGAQSLVASVSGLARRGRHVQVGLMGSGSSIPADVIARLIARELELVGSHGMAAHDYPPMLAAIAAGDLDPGRLVRHHVGLGEACTRLAALGAGGSDGVLIVEPARA